MTPSLTFDICGLYKKKRTGAREWKQESYEQVVAIGPEIDRALSPKRIADLHALTDASASWLQSSAAFRPLKTAAVNSWAPSLKWNWRMPSAFDRFAGTLTFFPQVHDRKVYL
jgi:hypothetical protein